jgi:hypothetical protein
MIPIGVDPQQVTRILFQDFAPWMVAIFYVYASGAIGVFCWGVYVQIRKYRSGSRVDASQWSNLRRRIVEAARIVASHSALRRRDSTTGWLHSGIFYGFLLLFIGTATITLQEDVAAPLFHVTFWRGPFYLIFKLTMSLAGFAFIAGVIYMMYRRGWLRPPKLDYARPDRRPADPDWNRDYYRIEDWAFLWTLVLIGLTGFLASGARLVWLQHDPAVWDTRWWAPIAAIIAAMLQSVGLGSDGAAHLRMALWWAHGFLALTFIALIPFTKAKHIRNLATSAADICFRLTPAPSAGVVTTHVRPAPPNIRCRHVISSSLCANARTANSARCFRGRAQPGGRFQSLGAGSPKSEPRRSGLAGNAEPARRYAQSASSTSP